MNLSIWKRVFSTRYGLPLGLCILLEGILLSVVNSLISTVISENIGLDKSEVTLFFIINVVLGAIITLGTGYLSDGTLARYKLVISCGAVATLGYLGIALATRPIHAFLACPVIVAIGVLFPQFFAVAKAGVVSDWSREDQIMGITALRTLFSLGYVFGTGFASWFARSMNLQDVFFLVAGALVFLTVYSGAVMYSIEKYIAEQERITAQSIGIKPIELRDVALPVSAMVMPLLALLVLRGADSTRGVFMPLVMFDLFHDAGIAPIMFGITAAAELITMGIISYISSRSNEKTAIAIGASVGTVYFMILSFSRSLPVLYGAHVLYAFFIAALLGVAMAYVQRLLADRVGMGGSIYIALMNAGSLLGILSPLLVDGYDQKIFIIPAVLCLVGIAMLIWGDHTDEAEAKVRATAAHTMS